MKQLGITFLLLFLAISLYPQTQNNCSNKLRLGQIFTNEIELKEWLVLYENDTTNMLTCLNKSNFDGILVDRLPAAISLLQSLSIKSSNEKVKRTAIKIFLTTSKLSNSEVASLSVNTLKKFPSKCFDDSDIDTIVSVIEKRPTIYKELVELAGYLGNPKFLITIKKLFPNSRSFTKVEKWVSYKAMARLGDIEALNFCINRVSSLPINDQVIDVLFPDLIYIHRKEAIDVIIKALNSDETNCTSSNPNSDVKILCGYRIMEMLAPVIENFPVKCLPSGDLDTKDYKKTLIQVRTWFSQNGRTYSIINKY